MKNILLFSLIIASYSLQSQTVDDFARWRVGMQIGSKSSPMAKGITNRVVTSPAADTLVTSRGVYNWVTGTLTFTGDVSGPYNNLALANTAVTPGIYTNATVTVDAKGRVTLISSGTAGATYTAGTGIAIDGSNVISNTAPNVVQTTITGNAGTATALQTPRTINGVAFDGTANITLPASEEPLIFSQGVTRATNTVTNDLVTGKAGSQTITGGTAANEDLTVQGTSSATKTTSYVNLQPSGGNVGIGTTTPGQKLDISGTGTPVVLLTTTSPSNNTAFRQAPTSGGNAYWDNGTVGTGTRFRVSNSSTTDLTAITIASTGKVGVGTTSPAASSVLDVTSTTAGLLAPRMTTTQRDAISSPAEGLIIYNLTAHKLNVYTGSAWETITSL